MQYFSTLILNIFSFLNLKKAKQALGIGGFLYMFTAFEGIEEEVILFFNFKKEWTSGTWPGCPS